MDVALQLRYESERTTVYETDVDSFLLADLTVTSDLSERAQLRIQLRNLLDEDYSLPGGWEHTQEALQQRGRDVRVGLNFRF